MATEMQRDNKTTKKRNKIITRDRTNNNKQNCKTVKRLEKDPKL